jgi:hypothetical protein
LRRQAEKIKGIDWGGNADELGRTLGASLRSNLADLKKDLTDFLNDPMVKDPFKGLDLFHDIKATLPDWKGPLDDLKQLVKTGNEVITVIDDLAKGRVDWALIFDLTGFKQMGANFKAALEPGGFLHAFREFFDAINRKAGIPGTPPAPAEILPPVQGQPSRPYTPRPETEDERHERWRQKHLKPWESMPTFSQANDNGLISKTAFVPGGQAAGSSSKSDAISMIAQGVRRGAYDALVDFYQMLKGMRDRSGVTNASYETGGGGTGGGAGGHGGGGGGHRVREGRRGRWWPSWQPCRQNWP